MGGGEAESLSFGTGKRSQQESPTFQGRCIGIWKFRGLSFFVRRSVPIRDQGENFVGCVCESSRARVVTREKVNLDRGSLQCRISSNYKSGRDRSQWLICAFKTGIPGSGHGERTAWVIQNQLGGLVSEVSVHAKSQMHSCIGFALLPLSENFKQISFREVGVLGGDRIPNDVSRSADGSEFGV